MGLENKVKDAFDCVKADEKLIDATKAFLQETRQHESRREADRPGKRKHLSRSRFRLAFGTACAMLAVFLCIGSYTMLWMPVAYVSIDVNPSLELELNRLDRVIAVRAYNEDGEEIVENVSVRGMRYEEAIETIVDSEGMQPYLTQDAALTFTVATENIAKEEQLLSDIAHTKSCVEYGGTSVRADMNLVGEAHGNGLSLGKYLVYQLILEYEPSVTVQDCHDMSMSELHGMLEEHEHGANHGDHHEAEYEMEYEKDSETEYEIEDQSSQSMQDSTEQSAEESESHHREDGHDVKHGHGH